MSDVNTAKPQGVSDSFYKQASQVILNQATTDAQLLEFMDSFYKSSDTSPGNLQAINILMNMRVQRSELISNLEEKRHRGAMSIVNNLK